MIIFIVIYFHHITTVHWWVLIIFSVVAVIILTIICARFLSTVQIGLESLFWIGLSSAAANFVVAIHWHWVVYIYICWIWNHLRIRFTVRDFGIFCIVIWMHYTEEAYDTRVINLRIWVMFWKYLHGFSLYQLLFPSHIYRKFHHIAMLSQRSFIILTIILRIFCWLSSL